MEKISVSGSARAAARPPRHVGLHAFILRRQVLLWLLLLLIGVTVFWGVTRHAVNTRLASQAQHELLVIEQVLRDVLDMETSVRGYAVTGREEYLGPYGEAREQLPVNYAALRRLVQDARGERTQEHLESIERAQQISRNWRATVAEPIIAARRVSQQAALGIIESGIGKNMNDAVRAELGAYRNDVRGRQLRLTEESVLALRQVQWITIASVLSAILVSFLTSSGVAALLAGVFGRMADASDRLATGQLDDPVRTSGLVEADALANNFNRMAQSLRTAQHHLERRNYELETAVEELDRMSAFNRLLLESAGEGILGLDRAGRTTFANPVAVQLTAYDEAELLGQLPHQLLHPARQDGTPCEVADCVLYASMRDGQTHHVDGEVFRRRDGSSFPVELVSAPLREDGEITGAVLMFRDITARKQAEAELLATNEELQRSNRELEQFAYVASHDLQGPLRTIASFSELVSRQYAGQLDEKADRYMAFIQSSVARMKRLIDDLLHFSRLRQEVHLQPTAAAAALEDALRALQADIQQSGASVSSGALPEVLCDPTQLTMVFQNLVGNAIKYAHPDRPPHVQVSAHHQHGMARFEVRDNGLGIEEQYREKVFVIFQRLHREDQIPGTGMGLAVCKSIVERHGGQTWVESVPGEGSTFVFTLRLA